MKPWIAAAAAVGLVTVATETSGALVEFNENLLALSRRHGVGGKRRPITFNMLEEEPLSSETLQLREGYYGGSDRIPCSMTETNTTAGEVTVVLAISKCLNESSIALIEEWIAKVQSEDLLFVDNGEQKKLTFSTTLIPGQCEARSEMEKAGRANRHRAPGRVEPDGDMAGGHNEEPEEPAEEVPGENVEDIQTPEEEGHIPKADEGEITHEDESETATETEPTHPETSENENENSPGTANMFLLSDGTDYRSSQQVLPGEVERIQAFAKYGRVLESIEAADPAVAVAVMSFVSDATSFEYITTYEAKHHFSKTFNFQICQDGENCEGHFENCVFLEEEVNLFMYNPFQITRSFQCNDLVSGIPVTYVDETSGKRECFCTCPAGWEMQEVGYGIHQCVEVEAKPCSCTWETHPYGFKHPNTEKLGECSFSDIATNWRVPVPFPSDNYVADSRVNRNDDQQPGPAEGPRIDVCVRPLHSNEYAYETLVGLYQAVYPGEAALVMPPSESELLSFLGQGELGAVSYPTSYYGSEERAHYTWTSYQRHRQEKIDAIKLMGYGKYELTIDAYDYDNNAQCVGCVAVVDQFRPKATTTCPKSFCDKSTSSCKVGESAVAELTPENVKKAGDLVTEFFNFKDSAENDACGSERCDQDEFSYRNFFESEYQPCSHGSACFEPEAIETDFKNSEKATKNPLKLANGAACQEQHPVPEYQCMRCCQYSTMLREFWVDYTCGTDYDVRRCEGDSDQTCGFEQCLVLTGDMVVEASARINDKIKESSESVLEHLRDQGYQTRTQIHHALPCSDFNTTDDKCSYTASVTDLIDVNAKNTYGGNVNTYAFWRYRIDGDAEHVWRLWEDTTPFTFATSETKITVEAWTACGRAHKFYFYVHLHLHTKIKVCEVFKQMWYQTSTSRAEIADTLCAYPGSDFAELTFDYQANMGLTHSRTKVPMHISQVTCQLAFPDRTPVEILHIESDSPDIVERFAIELQNLEDTTQDTTFEVTCTFNYKDKEGGTPTEQTCPIDFTITDCNGPVIDVPHGECTWDDCAGNQKPGPFEACGGKVVRATKTVSYMDTDDVECCDECKGEMPLACLPILNMPDASKDIKRCEPRLTHDAYAQEAYGTYEEDGGTYAYDSGTHQEYDSGYYEQAATLMAKAAAAHPTALAATALVAASGMVALVAVVVVRRRRALAAEAAVIIEDAYYPLLY